MAGSDVIYRFLFEDNPVRGELTQLEASWQSICQRQSYPPGVQKVLGEFAAAAVLLSSTLKYDGSLIIQAQGEGPVSLMVVECTSKRVIRATAKCNIENDLDSLSEMLGDGRLVITIDRGKNLERYQGIVELEGDTVATVLENYLRRSEQLETRIWLAADDRRTAGLLIQKLPGYTGDLDTWETAEQLSETVTNKEMLSLEPQNLIYRLFHAERVRLFDGEPVQFGCSCSRDRVVNALRTLGYDEVNSIIAEQGMVSVDCEFCGEHYEFDAVDVEQVFASVVIEPTNTTRH
jgi:molecular chaperone Hsp33